MAEKPVHLRDLFRTGKEVTIAVNNPDDLSEIIEVKLWMRKPTPSQHEEAVTKARAKSARRKREYADKESDAYFALWQEVEEITDVETILTQLVSFDMNDIRQQAYNEILYDPKWQPKRINEEGEEEPLWGENGERYIDILNAIAQRMDEIARHNAELSEEDKHLEINPASDLELEALDEERLEFEKAVKVRVDQIVEERKAALRDKSMGQLRELLFKRTIDIEASIAWYEEYRLNMLFAACRDPNDTHKHYFRTPEEIRELPPGISARLFDEFDELDKGVEKAKNWASPLPSFS